MRDPARSRPSVRQFAAFARDHGQSAAAMAIAWVLARGPHVIALPGSRSIAHMRDNIRGATLTLTATQRDEIARLLPVGWAHGARHGEAMSRGPQPYC
ncbi:aldo/keto reductase [Paracoccus salsus]|uniref:aldo/keto reductase n=1 Tax=Paracoccus salsus TaxID=2911061 RepID=UPI001F1FA884|nr:aldo/keto reductase [Paracoccus salsus]MCF3974764.1 aldo/keto reductase [Paracoccus salsus]